MLEAWYDQDVDYRDMMKDILKKRVRLSPVRIEISNPIFKEFKKLLCHKSPENIVLVNQVPLSYAFFSEAEKRLSKELREKLSYSPVTPQLPGWYHPGEKLMERVQKEDLFLSDSDIKALLVSVVNLIKNNAVKKAENVFKQQVFYYQNLLKLNMAKLEQANQEIKKLKGK
jgi:polyphosphate kinase